MWSNADVRRTKITNNNILKCSSQDISSIPEFVKGHVDFCVTKLSQVPNNVHGGRRHPVDIERNSQQITAGSPAG
jgi:hypothetical protein